MKKILALLLSLIIVFSSLSVAVFADDSELNFAVATDLHSRYEETLPVNYPESELYFHARNTGNLYQEALGILRTFLDKAEENELDFVLIAGDLADNGAEEQHRLVADILEDFEKTSKIPVYVIPGNHDYKDTDVDGFKKIYADFGFNEALTVDSETASYTVDLPGNYRLIAVDSNDPGKDGDGIDDRLLGWIEEQAACAEKDGKTVIYMMHHPLLDPIPYAEILMSDFIVKNHEEIAEKFTEWGISYVFTGHEHGNNITSFTGLNGKTVYDILTTSLTAYPLEYRLVKFSDKSVDIKTEAVTECNFDYLCKGYTAEQLTLMESDYTRYSYEYFRYSIERKIAKYITPEFIKDKLKTDDGILADAIDTVMPLVTKALYMPLYDDSTGNESVEAIAAKSGVSLPETDYKNLFDLVTALVADVYYGNENLPLDSAPEGKLLIVALNTMLKYILNEAGNETVRLVVNSLVKDSALTEDKKIFVLNEIYVPLSDCVYSTAITLLSPVLGDFLEDDEIPDRDVTLPLVKANEEKSFSFGEILVKIKNFIEDFIEKLTRIFSIK